MLENIVPWAEPIQTVETLPLPAEPVQRQPLEPPAVVSVPEVTQKPQPAQPAYAQPTVRARPVRSPSPTTAPAVPPPPPQPQPPAQKVQSKAPSSRPGAETIEYGKTEIVAASLIQVNDKFLTVDDILRGARQRLEAVSKSISHVAYQRRVRQIIIEEISSRVIASLVYAEADKYLTERHKKAIDSELEYELRTMIAEIGGSRQKLEADIAQRGTDLDTLLADMRRSLSIQRFLQGRFLPAITISRSDLWNYYRKSRSQFASSTKVQMQIIFVPHDKFLPAGSTRPSRQERAAAVTRTKETIDQAAAAIEAGEGFGLVARRMSSGLKADSGGVWPMMEAGSFRQQKVEKAAFALNEGQVSDVITTPAGYYIVKAKKVQHGETVSFEDAQEQIEQKLRQQELAMLQEDYFQRLRDSAYVRRSDEFLAMAVERAMKTYRQR